MLFPYSFRRAISCLTLFALLTLTVSPVLANRAPPDPPERLGPVIVPTTTVPLQVKKHAGQTTIKIPAAVLATLRQANDEKTGAVAPIHRTVIAGLALALAAACGFVVVGRRVNHPRALATAVVLLMAALWFMADATADLIPGKPLGPVKEKSNDQQIVVEVTQDGKTIELLIGKDATWAK